MSTNITLKRSSVQGKVPVVGDLALGEIALNTYDGKVFIKKNVGGTESIVDVTANTNLSLTSNSSTVSVNSDRGTDVTILAANATTAGVLTATDQTIVGIKTFSSNVVISSAITANGSVGTAGQVLTSNSTGTYWASPTPLTATYNTTIGDASATSFTVTHSLNKANIFVSIRDVSTGYFVYPDVKYTSTNAVVLEFVDPPTASQYYVAVIGA